MENTASGYQLKPLLVFWETTKACDLACRHCRATSMKLPAEDELTLDQSIDFLNQLTEFNGKPPVLIMTGGDVMKKRNLAEIMDHARDVKIPFALSPAVTGLGNEGSLTLVKNSGASSISISLDGGAEFHDYLRGAGVFQTTIRTLIALKESGINIQVNTLVSRNNLTDLPWVLKILLENGIKTWEIFFLIKVGRGMDVEDVTPEQYDAACKFLVYAAGYGINIRTVEGPYFRKLSIDHNNGLSHENNRLFLKLKETAIKLCGHPEHSRDRIPVAKTSDGNGIIFVSHNGNVRPSGFLPFDVGNILDKPLVEVYEDNETLKRLRDRSNITGKCRVCQYLEVCGGSRARAYFYSGEVFGEDPVCPFQPKEEGPD
jgi:radical SAM protein